ncbi:MAG: hypothetical protein ACRC92_27030 [Peptostreptococcaceae bacterium]
MEKKTLTERVMEAIGGEKFVKLQYHIKDGTLKISKENGVSVENTYSLEFKREGYKGLNEKGLDKDNVRLFVQGIAAHHLVDWTQSK